MKNNILFFYGLLLTAIISLRCSEELPSYSAPENVLSINVDAVEALSDRIGPPGNQMMRVKIIGQNIYDEVFFDTVNIQGTMTISWPRKPGRVRTLTFDERNFLDRNLIVNRKMMLVPGQQFVLQFIWNMKGDDSTYFPAEMNYPRARMRACGSYESRTVICSNEEDLVIEGTMTVFNNLGTVQIPAKGFVAVGRSIINP